jgi:predicted DNA-binding transcriptional regulator AlpA
MAGLDNREKTGESQIAFLENEIKKAIEEKKSE